MILGLSRVRPRIAVITLRLDTGRPRIFHRHEWCLKQSRTLTRLLSVEGVLHCLLVFQVQLFYVTVPGYGSVTPLYFILQLCLLRLAEVIGSNQHF